MDNVKHINATPFYHVVHEGLAAQHLSEHRPLRLGG
jgi:acyl-ACP thioesterase